MATSGIANVEDLLERWREGDAEALNRLLPLVYSELRRLARRVLRATPGHFTLQTTALVHEVCLRLLGREPAAFESEAHLFNAAARMMRQILVSRARKASAEKRGGRWRRDEFADALALPIPDDTDMLALDQALTDLEAVNQRMAQVVQLRYFVGLELAEAASALSISERTAQRDWVAARSWLRSRLEGGP
ncbi:ECF-type sigma factor [Dokdonella sp.]|uniref:ECF-type sigma factor n=1 Tax=Dokdonella sp. TaxID=2291710 RepID=UPI0031C47EFB|nr:ECF-type sigma factor [Dokdonella sp.]